VQLYPLLFIPANRLGSLKPNEFFLGHVVDSPKAPAKCEGQSLFSESEEISLLCCTAAVSPFIYIGEYEQ